MSVSRRKFLGQSVLSLAAFSIVPRHVLGKGFIAPSDQLTKAIIGTGGMGRGHIPYAGTRVVALCDVDKKISNSVWIKLRKESKPSRIIVR